jgi:thiol-disulfide isomerase/thioredoxin
LALLGACATVPAHEPAVGERPFASDPGGVALASQLIGEPTGKPVLVVVFATWAESARPLLGRLAGLAAASPGVEVRGVAIDEDPRFVEPYLKELEIRFPVVADPGGRQLGQRLLVSQVPSLYLLDAQGVVRAFASATGPESVPAIQGALSRIQSGASSAANLQ